MLKTVLNWILDEHLNKFTLFTRSLSRINLTCELQGTNVISKKIITCSITFYMNNVPLTKKVYLRWRRAPRPTRFGRHLGTAWVNTLTVLKSKLEAPPEEERISIKWTPRSLREKNGSSYRYKILVPQNLLEFQT